MRQCRPCIKYTHILPSPMFVSLATLELTPTILYRPCSSRPKSSVMNVTSCPLSKLTFYTDKFQYEHTDKRRATFWNWNTLSYTLIPRNGKESLNSPLSSMQVIHREMNLNPMSSNKPASKEGLHHTRTLLCGIGYTYITQQL